MPTLVNYSGEDDFCSAGSVYSNFIDSSIFLSIGTHVDICCPPRKRSRIAASDFSLGKAEKEERASLDALPDECLFEIFRRVPDGQERSACACVSKRWLLVLSSIRANDTFVGAFHKVDNVKNCSGSEHEFDFTDDEQAGDGFLTRCVEGKKATDVRLAAIAVGTSKHGGLGKLMIRGCNSMRPVTDLGLSAIAQGCPSLHVLSLWNLPIAGDEGLTEIAKNCSVLEKLDLCNCPLVSDDALVAISKNCSKLSSLTIESCPRIGDEGLKALARSCPNLKYISIKDCHLVGDQTIAALVSSASSVVTKIKLQDLNVSDMSLAVIGYYGKNVTDLTLTGLKNTTEKGFWILGSAVGLQKLKTLTLIACQGVTDIGLDAIANGCPNLKQLMLRRSSVLSDEGLKSFSRAALSLESLHIEECNRVTQVGVLSALSHCCSKLKSLSLIKCLGIRETLSDVVHLSQCNSLRSLSIRNCPGFGGSGLAMVGKLCPKLQYLDLEGTCGATDAGLLMLLKSCEAGLVKVNLTGCINISDVVVSSLVKLHGATLELLNLGGCRKITDHSLVAISEYCSTLVDLDLSRSGVSDFGLAMLARANQLGLQVLSFSECSNVSEKSIPFFISMASSLVGLNLQHCNSFSTRSVGMLGEKLWSCDILF